MKKIFIVLFSLIGLVVLAGLIVPVIFKDDIKAKIDEQLNSMLNATVVFDTDNFSISVFKNFPNITVGLENFGVVNNAPFEGEILFAAREFNVVVNLKKVLIDGEYAVEGIYLDGPEINILVNEDGTANYDIYISEESTDEEVVVEEEPSEDMQFSIEKWAITNAHLVYNDATIPIVAEFKGFNHSGSGDFSLTVFDLETETTIDTAILIFDGVTYLNNQSIGLDATLGMDLDAMSFTFKDNSASVNDFMLGFDGWFAMPEDGFDMDITFKSTDNSFKSLLSLVPAVYMEGFEELSTSGSLSFDGFVKGKYTESAMPSFGMNLLVENGHMQYPDLPSSLENVNVDMHIENMDGDPLNTLVDIRNFHIDLGNNPFDGNLKIENLINYPVQANLYGKLNLAELNQMFPMEGLEMKGTLEMKISANGVYDSIAETIPKLDMLFKLTDGYVSSPDMPFPLEDLQVTSSIINSTGKLADTEIRVDESVIMTGEKLQSSMLINNMDDPQWDVSMTGRVDFEKIMPAIQEFYPMPTTTISGIIDADAHTRGKMSDLDAERYERMPTSGSFKVSNFNYTDTELLPQGFNISRATMILSPDQINLTEFQSTIGRSDMNMNGRINNYINYIFRDEVIEGTLNLQSNLMDLNEFMTEEDPEETVSEDTTALEVIPIPRNIDFVFTSRISKILYENKVMENATGQITVRDGEVILDGFTINMLGGSIGMTGRYNTHDVNHPYFDYALDIKKLSIGQSYATFNTVQQLAPIAKNVTGDFSTQFNIKGNLDNTMMPDYATLAGGGLIEILQATLKGSKIMAGVNALTSQANPDEVSLSKILMSAEIKDGRFSVEPFDVKVGSYQSNVSGSNGLDGSLDYVMKMDIPAGQLGQQLNQTIASLTGTSTNPSSTIKLNIGIGGTYDDPKPKLLSADAGQGMKQAVTEEAKAEVTKAIQKEIGDKVDVEKITDTETMKEEAKQEIDTVKTEVKDIAKSQADSLKKGILAGDTATVENAVKDAQDKIQNLFNKKKKKN